MSILDFPLNPSRVAESDVSALLPVSDPVGVGSVVFGPAGAGTDSPEGGGSLPCLLLSHISIEIDAPLAKIGPIKLSGSARKSAFILAESVQLMAKNFGLSNLGFLTLTFADQVTCPREAQRRLNSFISNVINDRYRGYVGVFERQKSGRVHYHLLVALWHDIRSGFDFSAVDNQDYRSASKALRQEWSFLRKAAPRYGFGRTELLPVKSSSTAIGRYVGKYIAKHMAVRSDDDKGIRLVRYSRGCRAGTANFQFLHPGTATWRRKLAVFAGIVQEHHQDEVISGIADLTRVLGPRWCYWNRGFIESLP